MKETVGHNAGMGQNGVAATSQSERRGMEACHVFEGMIFAAPMLKIDRRHTDAGSAGSRFFQFNQPLSPGYGAGAARNTLR